ncbi:MAG: Holliday junction resolvase RuvX [Saprospiraceae bacterium]|jgi:putative Holliday junction resolvase
MGRIVGIDYGSKRSGIAVTDPLKIIASGLVTVPTHELMDFLIRYVGSEDVESFVVGLPLYPDGNPAQLTDQVEAFVRKLRQQFVEKPVFRQDERNTSNDAKRIILASGVKKQKRRDKSLVDKVAAALILEQYMQANHW